MDYKRKFVTANGLNPNASRVVDRIKTNNRIFILYATYSNWQKGHRGKWKQHITDYKLQIILNSRTKEHWFSVKKHNLVGLKNFIQKIIRYKHHLDFRRVYWKHWMECHAICILRR